MGRDNSLDYIKGLACLLMILAHSKIQVTNSLVKELCFIGGFAPVLFFGVSGITATLQLKKRTLAEMFIFYCIFFFLGFSFNGIEQVKYWQYPQSEILQCIAVNTMITVYLYKKVGPEKILWLVPFPFLLHLGSYSIAVKFPLKQFVVNPGIFPIFPWLSFFLMGVYIYHNHVKRVSLVLLLAITTFVVSLSQGVDYHDKWDMNWGYFSLAVFLFTSVTFTLKKLNLSSRLLAFLGRNSLLFLFCHYGILRSIHYFGVQIPVIAWCINLVLTLIVMKCLLVLNQLMVEKIKLNYSNPLLWVIISALVLFDPIILPSDIVYYSSYVLGIVISLNYHRLYSLVKRGSHQTETSNSLAA